MDFYDEMHAGVKLPTANTGIVAAPVETTTLRGYFSKDDINTLLNQNDDCIGIRIYNIDPRTGNFRLMSVGVKKDGFELIDLYILSHDAGSSAHNMPSERIAARSVAFGLAEAGRPGLSQFGSFFSKEMLRPLLEPNNTFSGIAFYETNMGAIHNDDLLSHMDNIKTATHTHIAVASNINDGGEIIVNPSPASNNVLSDIPCPGHCIKIESGTPTRGRFPQQGTGAITDPYLIEW